MALQPAPIQQPMVKFPIGGESKPWFNWVPLVFGIWSQWFADVRSAINGNGMAALVTFAAGNFTSSGAGGWTVASGDQVSFFWTPVGNGTVILSLTLATTSVTAPLGTDLMVALPAGRVVLYSSSVAIRAVDNGAVVAAEAFAIAGESVVRFKKADGTNWAASVNNTAIRCVFPIAVVS